MQISVGKTICVKVLFTLDRKRFLTFPLVVLKFFLYPMHSILNRNRPRCRSPCALATPKAVLFAARTHLTGLKEILYAEAEKPKSPVSFVRI